MSRHKMIKNLDLDDEMDDMYGEDDDYYEEGGSSQGTCLLFLLTGLKLRQKPAELSPEDQEQMRLNTPKVRVQLPQNAKHVTDKQIQDSLWHYFYDIEQSVAYLSKTFGIKEKKVADAKPKNTGGLSFLFRFFACFHQKRWGLI